MRRGRVRYRQTPTACPAARASLYLYGWNPLRSTRFRVDKIPQRLDRPPAPPRGSRGDWLKSLILSTSTASTGHGEVPRGSGRASWLLSRSDGSLPNPVHQLRTHAGRRWRWVFLIHHPAGNHSSCPGGRFRAAFPRLRALVPGVSTGSRIFFSRTLPCGRARLIHKPSEADVVHQPQCQKKRPDTRTAKTHKGQQDTGYRHESRHHPHIHENVEPQQGRHPHTYVHPYPIRRRMRILDDAHHQHKKQRQQNRYPHEPMLLGKRRKDEVLVGRRQEPQLGLSSLGNALAEHPSRAYRNLGLDQLISLALRIALGVHETDDPPLLVLIQKLPTDGQHHHRHNRDGGHILPAQSGQKRTHDQDCQVRQRGP